MFKFTFEASTDDLSPFPHVALVTWKREWNMLYKKTFPFQEYPSDNEVLVVAEYTARPGNIIEKQTRKHRSWYLVTEEGDEVKVADALNDGHREKIARYLRGEVPVEKLLNESRK